MIPAVISGVSALGSMILGHQQQRQAEHANQASADKQMAFQQRQSETQYQRCRGYESSRIKPGSRLFSRWRFQRLWGSASAPPTNPTDLSKIASSAIDSARLKREQEALESQKVLNAAQAAAAVSGAKVSDATALKTHAETEALRAEVPARKSEALYRKKKADIDSDAVKYDAIMNRVGQAVDVGSSAVGIGRGVRELKKLVPKKSEPFRGRTMHRDGDPLGRTSDGQVFNKRTGEIYD